MLDPTTDLTHRVVRLEWHVMALTIACIVLVRVAGTALALPFVGIGTPDVDTKVASLTADTIDVDTLHAGFLTAESAIVKDATGRMRASLVVGKDSPMPGLFDESGNLMWKAP